MAEVVRVSILGAMPGGEVWSTNPVFSLDLAPTEITQAEAQAIANAVTAIAIPTGLLNITNTGVTWTGTRVEARDRNGVLESQAEAMRGTPTPGLSNTPHPYQTSVVASLRTSFPGGQGRGRLYFPATGVSLDSTTLRVTSGTLTSIRDSVKTYLSAIQTAVAASAGSCRLCVWSRTGTAMHTVNSIRVGNIADTQRRRRDALIELYSEVSYP